MGVDNSRGFEMEDLPFVLDGIPRVVDVFDVLSLGRPLAPSRPYTQSRFRSWQALHILWPEHLIFLERQKWQLFRMERTGLPSERVESIGEPVDRGSWWEVMFGL